MPYNPYSPLFSSIFIYIIIILIIVIIKPDFIYDHNNKKFREFGLTDNKTLLNLISFGIITSILIYIFVIMLVDSKKRYEKYYYNY